MAPPKQRYPEVDQISHIRYSPAGDIALVSPARGKKPTSSIDQACIFCPESRDKLAESFLKGNSLDEMLERGLYILDNAFPVVSVPDSAGGNDAGRASPAGFNPVFYDMRIAHGRHLVMIETDNHHLNPFSDGAETKGYYQNLVWGYIQMLKSLEAEGYVWGGVGKNRNGLTAEGRVIDAGASQRHPHSQAIAMNGLVPRGLEDYVLSTNEVNDRLKSDGKALMLQGCSGCLEVRDNRYSSRLLYANKTHVSFVAPVPKSQHPYHVEIRIAPYNHQSHFENMSPQEADSFADVLHRTMVLLGLQFPNMGYNFELRQGPWKPGRGGDARASHWEFSIYPAWPALDTEKHTGFIPHLLGASVLKVAPEEIAGRILGK